MMSQVCIIRIATATPPDVHGAFVAYASTTAVMFVLHDMMREPEPGSGGKPLSFGPGLTAETMNFHAV